MFEGLITSVLNRVLGDFIEGIEADQLSISLLSGDVELKNLSIVPTILDNMPLPFKIKYGKVGRIFVDVPVTSILSSPLKIEISDIFMLVQPKEVSEWDEKIIKEAFIAGVQSQLVTLEEQFKAQLEIQNAEPGMAGNMVNSIIDNIQIDIKNICFKFEDSISNPKMPYAIGINLAAIQLYTCNDKWEREFVSGEDISLKMAKITDFELYLDFAEQGTDEVNSIMFGDFEEDMDLEEVVGKQLSSERKHRNLIEKFCIEARVKLNKNPKKNQQPMLDVNLVIGGKFIEGKNELVDSEEGIGFFKLQKQQMNCILKYLDYSTNYTKFQTGIQKNVLANKFTKEQSQHYISVYEEWKNNSGDNKSAGEKQKAEQKCEELKEIEKDYSYEIIAALRQLTIKKYNLDYRKNQERDSMLQKIKQFEDSKAEGYLSGIWGGKSEQEREQDQRDIEAFKERLNKEFEEKFKDEEEKIKDKMDDLEENEPIFDQEALKDMPDEWTKIIANVVIPKLRLVLLDEDSRAEEEKSIMEIQSLGMMTKAQLGQDWQEVDLSFGQFNIIDNVTGSEIYKYMVETVFPGTQPYHDKEALTLHFESNPRFEDGEMKLKLYSKANQYIFANMSLVKELQEFFAGGEAPEDQVDLSYYTDRAKMRALEYINQGADYLEETQETEYVHKGINVDIELFAPVLVVPESITELTNKKTLVFNIGYLRMTSEICPYHKEVDYKIVKRGEEIYDRYEVKINGFQLSMIDELSEYKKWYDAEKKIDIISQITINMNINRSVEPNHPKFPAIEMFCKIMDIDIFFSDYIMANLMNIQTALMPPAEEKVVEIDEDEESRILRREESRNQESADFARKNLGQHKNAIQEDSDEDLEGEENVEDDIDENFNQTRTLSIKSKSDVDNNLENQFMKLEKKLDTKVEQRILIIFDKMTITIGETVPLNVAGNTEYEGVIDPERSEIPHLNILELSLEGMEIEVNNGQQQNINLVLSRLYMKDLQKKREIVDGIEEEAKSIIPSCFQMIISNPEIENDMTEESLCYTIRTDAFKSENFKSVIGDEEGSFVTNAYNESNVAQLKVGIKISGPTTDVEFTFSNLRMIVTLPILERLSKFQAKVAKIQEANKVNTGKEEAYHQINEPELEDSDGFEDRSRLLKTQVMSILEEQKEKKESKKNKKGYYERYKEQRNKYLMKGKRLKIKVINQLTRLRAKGRLCNFDIWVPLNSLNQYSRVLSLELSSNVGYRATTHIRHKINEITNEMISSDLVKNQQDANVVLSDLSISMINRHLLEVQNELTTENIFLPSRIDLNYDKFVNTDKEFDVTNVEITIDPIDLKVGFREVDNFKELGEVMGEFSSRISAPPEEEQKLNLDEKEGIEALRETQHIEDDHKQNVDEIAKEMQVAQRKIPIRERIRKEFIKMNVKLASESINFALMDDTGLHEYPLVNVSINRILATVSTETGEDDAANYVLKKMGISQWPHLKLDAALVFEANYFNLYSGSYEPIIEPWTFNALILQKTAYSAQEIKLSSEQMLNLNLTYGMALAVHRIQTKMGEGTEQWEDEKKNEETKRKTKSMHQKKSTIKNPRKTTNTNRHENAEEDEEIPGFFFESYLGLAMRITLENHDSWKDQGIVLSEDDEDSSVIFFHQWEEQGDRNFRELKELKTMNKKIKKKLNDGKFVGSMEEEIIRYDIYIEGFEPITGIPIEISGRRSYELNPEESKDPKKKKKKNDKHQYSLTVDVETEGRRKVVSFESQLSLINKTEFEIEIAKVFSETLSKNQNELKESEVRNCLQVMKGEAKQKGKKVTKYEDMQIFEVVGPSDEYKVPLMWFMEEVEIFYK